MLNRRLLRIKAMQSLYAYKQSKQSDYHIAIDVIRQTFAPDLNSMEVQNKELLDENKKQAILLFEDQYQAEGIKFDQSHAESSYNAAADALEFYKKQLKKDAEFFKKQMLLQTEEIHDRYIFILLLLLEWSELSHLEFEKKSKRPEKPMPAGILNLYQNKVLSRFANSKIFQIEAIKRNIDWTEERENVRQWFKEIVKKDEVFQDYNKIEAPSFEEDKQVLLHIVKNIVFKNEILKNFWEEQDIHWAENRSIIKNMVLKTLKNVSEDGIDADPHFMELSTNWEDDKEFFLALFTQCIKHDYQYEALVSKKAKNWDVERIAAVDKVILEMAICEMINFPSIPVKVTINEYIDISKTYSTPKSKQFVNGILDVLAEELQEEGVIKKSGRGLIDNK